MLAGLLLLAGCSSGDTLPPEEAVPYALQISTDGIPDTLDPAKGAGETVFYHLYENLLRWEDDGTGWGRLAPGQAEQWTMETDYAGNATYTFTLRESACWSDGRAVTAADFVTAWQRLANPANALPHRELLSAISGYAAVQETGEIDKLAVSAPDARTLTVTLSGSPAWFLADVCAGAYTMPVREDLRGSWDKGTVTNGPYTAAEFTSRLVRLERSVTYYDATGVGPEELCFQAAGDPMADYDRLTAGELDLVTVLPDSLEKAEDWTAEPVTSGYGALLNLSAPPFDNPDIRQAFRMVIDPTGLELGPTVQAAAGLVPYGVSDYSERPEPAEGEKRYWDFRTHSLEQVTMPEAEEYEENCRLARRILAQAGYPQGEDFPMVEYVYVDCAENAAIAQALRRMWQEQLGVAVMTRGLSQEEYDAFVTPIVKPDPEAEEPDGEETPEEDGTVFQLAGWSYSAEYNDAAALLEFWGSGNTANPTGYASKAFDLALEAARTAPEPDVRDALLHDAEALLLQDGPVIPVCYSGGSYALAEKWTGLYRNPDGVYFLYHVCEAS